jgi:integrase
MAGHKVRRREHGEGSIDQRGLDAFRLRYRIGGKRFTVTFKGTRQEAKTKLRELLRAGDTGEHVAPDRMTFGDWAKLWISLGAPSRRKRAPRQRAIERYEQLLRVHVLPDLGGKRLQSLASTDIDALYKRVAENAAAPRTQRHIHSVLNACLGAAVRTGKLNANPMDRVQKVPDAGDDDELGQALDEKQLSSLVQGFKQSALFPIVAVAAYTGARRGEILALRWSDFNPEAKDSEGKPAPTLRIERAVEETKVHGRIIKPPKTKRGLRTNRIDENLSKLLLREREKHQRLVAGVPDGIDVDLSLVKLPEGALMFPSFAGEFDLTKLRDGHAVSREFSRQARRRGFNGLTFKDLRSSHETILLDRGVPVHVVAKRCGHDPAVLLRSYAKRTKTADTAASDIIESLSGVALA